MAHYEEAIVVLTPIDELAKHLWYAKAGLAVTYFRAQRYSEAAERLKEALLHYDRTDDKLEVLRTLTHLVELNLNRRSLMEAVEWSRRLRTETCAASVYMHKRVHERKRP